MDLHFLCAYHEHLVLNDKHRAEELWQGLVVHGKFELRQEHWARAASFFGSAAEIALLRASVEQYQQQVESLNRSIYTSEFVVDSFCRLGDISTATGYLEQLEKNYENLLSREPSVKNIALDDSDVKSRVFESVELCYALIRQANNNLVSLKTVEFEITEQQNHQINNICTLQPRKTTRKTAGAPNSLYSKYKASSKSRVNQLH